MSTDQSGAPRHGPETASDQSIHTDLPATLRAPRQARLTVRSVLSSWGLGNLSNDAELLASELVANAAEHTDGSPIGLTIRKHAEPSGQRGILCQVTDAVPDVPHPQAAEADSERGRGLQVVASVATSSGFTSSPQGKTAWFTLSINQDRSPARRADFGAEASA